MYQKDRDRLFVILKNGKGYISLGTLIGCFKMDCDTNNFYKIQS